ncbi:MAG: DNA ligase [Campylobacterales bacterium]|nr:DNA ligase [Campylobacterales bacterium]
MIKKICLFIFFTGTLLSQGLMLAKNYHEQNITGWLMSEKLDGVRGVWNGKTLLSKSGKDLNPPKWFIKNFPPFSIEGELWTKRGDFENIISIVNRKKEKIKWKELSLNVFDVIEKESTFQQRIKRVKIWLKNNPSQYMKVIEQTPCNSKSHLNSFLKNIEKLGGEGVIIRDSNSFYKSGRSVQILKVKTFHDDEATVIKINQGKGKFKGLMGSITVRLKNGIIFNIGNGFTLENRKNPPKLGEMVTFKYKELTKNGKPKFASFKRVRKVIK